MTVKPELVFNAPGWDDELLEAFGGEAVSIENSVTIFRTPCTSPTAPGWSRVGTSAAWRRAGPQARLPVLDRRRHRRIDRRGLRRDALHRLRYEKQNARSRQVGQMMKLDPSKPDDPIVWNIVMPESGGVWGTPALYQDVMVYDTNAGDILAVDRMTGDIRWKKKLPGPTWQSPS